MDAASTSGTVHLPWQRSSQGLPGQSGSVSGSKGSGWTTSEVGFQLAVLQRHELSSLYEGQWLKLRDTIPTSPTEQLGGDTCGSHRFKPIHLEALDPGYCQRKQLSRACFLQKTQQTPQAAPHLPAHRKVHSSRPRKAASQGIPSQQCLLSSLPNTHFGPAVLEEQPAMMQGEKIVEDWAGVCQTTQNALC